MAQTEKNGINNDANFYDNKNQDDIINEFKNFYDLNPANIIINNPYNFKRALEILDNLNIEQFTKDLNEIIQKEIDLDFLSNKNSVNFSLNNILFLTSKSSLNNSEFILLNDFKQEDYISIPKYDISSNEILNTGINIRIYKKEDGKKEINIKCIVNYEKFAI